MLHSDPEVTYGDKQLTKAEMVARALECSARIKELDIAERIIIGSLNSGSVRTDLISAIANWRHHTKKRQAALVTSILTQELSNELS